MPISTSTRPRTGAPPVPLARPEVEGLRALAVSLVVVYHVWIGRVSGGVDVFFVLTGFFLTTSLVRQAAASGRVDVRSHVSRLARRLTPAAAVVLTVTLVASVVLLPRSRWVATIPQFPASLFHLENWALARAAVDYGADHRTAGPVQHFWSLSVQVQVHLLWLVLVSAAVALLGRRYGVRRAVAGVLAVVLVLSLAYSVVTTDARQEVAYFDTLARLWEFAAAGLLALGAASLAPGRRTRVVLGWAGVLGLVALGASVDVSSLFPGWLAAWPVLCAAAVLVAGRTGSRWGADRVLDTRTAQWLGARSYALYLWHWPVLVLYLEATDRDAPGLRGGLCVVALSVALAAGTAVLVDRLSAGPRAAAAAGSVRPHGAVRTTARWVAPLLVLTSVWAGYVHVDGRPVSVQADDPDHPGALALADGFVYEGAADATLVPAATATGDDTTWWAREHVPGWSCSTPTGSIVRYCTVPVGGSQARRVVVVGDSHSDQLTNAVAEIAESRDYEVVTATRGSCAFSLDPEHLAGDPGAYRDCLRHNRELVEVLRRDPPHLVVTVGSRAAEDSPAERVPEGYQAAWDALTDAGIPVLVARDNARFGLDPNDCLERAGEDVRACDVVEADAYAPENPLAAAAAPRDLVRDLDVVPLLCNGDGTCSVAVGNVRVYHDSNHLGASYVRTMAPWFAEVLDDTGW
ncbi:acyltransferase family protein [Geodermatophilus dictyosporus]|uniref:acyltransferase family protein n=1 Tax=Geodermatophilus dictyosporus TaxID=1523247 RepID=UPI00145C2908|nr:acyltransferase family protein [Geodermatophilus dictyosporus]